MCGINGIFAYHTAAAPPDRRELLRTRDAMRRRGPDGSGAWWSADRRVALGHRRLSILDLSSRAAQPMTSADGRLAVTYNGEIYNFPELRAELERDGVRFRTSSDTEVLLHLYARSGPTMVHRLRGMFAFAIWDDRSGELFLARDPYGIKPLYTANDGWTFRFASQVKALLAGGRVSRDPEPAGLVGFYLFGSVPEPFTLYREIRALPAGHTQIVDAGGPARAASVRQSRRGARRRRPRSGAGRRTRGTGARRRARQRPGASSRRCRGRRVSLGRHRFGRRARTDARRRTAENPRDHAAFDEFRGTAEDEAPLAAEVAARYGAEHIVRRVDRERVRARSAGHSRRDGPAVDRRGQHLVRREGGERGRSQGRAVGPRRRRAAGRLSELSATCRAGVAVSARCRRSGAWASRAECCCEPLRSRLLRQASEGGRSA